jgi:hypothetical protein
MLVELTWNNIFIKGRSSVLDGIEEKVFSQNADECLYSFLTLNESMPKKLKLTSLVLERLSPTEMTINVDSNGDLINEFLLKLSSVHKLHITCKYEDDSMDIGGTFVCKNGTVLKDLSYSYLAHRYIEGGIDDIVLDIEEYIKEGETFDDFMSEQGLWVFITKTDRDTIYNMFNQE